MKVIPLLHGSGPPKGADSQTPGGAQLAGLEAGERPSRRALAGLSASKALQAVMAIAALALVALLFMQAGGRCAGTGAPQCGAAPMARSARTSLDGRAMRAKTRAAPVPAILSTSEFPGVCQREVHSTRTMAPLSAVQQLLPASWPVPTPPGAARRSSVRCGPIAPSLARANLPLRRRRGLPALTQGSMDFIGPNPAELEVTEESPLATPIPRNASSAEGTTTPILGRRLAQLCPPGNVLVGVSRSSQRNALRVHLIRSFRRKCS